VPLYLSKGTGPHRSPRAQAPRRGPRQDPGNGGWWSVGQGDCGEAQDQSDETHVLVRESIGVTDSNRPIRTRTYGGVVGDLRGDRRPYADQAGLPD